MRIFFHKHNEYMKLSKPIQYSKKLGIKDILFGTLIFNC